MCGTASNKKTTKAIEERFKAQFAANIVWEPILQAFAFAGDKLPIITAAEPKVIQLFEWGLVPHYTRTAEDAKKIRVQTINCRTETIFDKPSFKHSATHQRCLVLADGFVEYQHHSAGLQPYYITLSEEKLFAMAGIYSTWLHPTTGIKHNTFSIATVPANNLMAEIHNTKKRMPLILPEGAEQQWLEIENEDEVKKLFQIYDEADMQAVPIAKNISSKGFTPHADMYKPVEVIRQSSLFD
jgi:putative SOS response-associated peptidase YedK